MRVLIVSKEVWRDDQNGGNTLSSIFSAFSEDTEFAQIFCSEGTPDNKICTKYYKMSTSDIAHAIKSRCDAGCEINVDSKNATADNAEGNNQDENEQNDVTKFATVSNSQNITNDTSRRRSFTNNEFFRELVWKSGKYKSETLKNFITEFNPDIVFAPGYGVFYMNSLTLWIASFVKCPIVSLISDDYYTYSVRSLNPLWWINLFFLRGKIRKTAKCYNLIYTMTDIQKRQLEHDFNKPVRILIKGTDVENITFNSEIHNPIRMVYAGNLALNRWKTLKALSAEIERINKIERTKELEEHSSDSSENADIISSSVKFALDIYSNNAVDEKLVSQFAEFESVNLHNGVSYSEIMEIYRNSDIALHVEGFDLINREKVKMSFSTKIVDCLACGCAVMCICDKHQGGYEYLNSNDLAICASTAEEIRIMMEKVRDNPEIINEYRRKAGDFVIKNHDHKNVMKSLVRDFGELTGK